MNKLSLRLRLIVCFIGISCVVWLAAGVLSWKETKEKVDEFFDTYQMALARQLAGADWSGLAAGAQKITDRMIENVHNADDEDEAIGFAVFDRDGRLVFHDNENGKDFGFLPATGSFIRQIVDGDDEWRIVWLQSADGKFYIAVGQEEEYRADVVWDMTEEFMIPWAAGLFVLMVMIVAVLTREFRPLGNLADSLQSRGSGDLSPLEEKGIPAEILPLVKAMNIQMARIEGMLAGERRFVADAAHELRTPLTALQVQLEVAEMAGSDEKCVPRLWISCRKALSVRRVWLNSCWYCPRWIRLSAYMTSIAKTSTGSRLPMICRLIMRQRLRRKNRHFR